MARRKARTVRGGSTVPRNGHRRHEVHAEPRAVLTNAARIDELERRLAKLEALLRREGGKANHIEVAGDEVTVGPPGESLGIAGEAAAPDEPERVDQRVPVEGYWRPDLRKPVGDRVAVEELWERAGSEQADDGATAATDGEAKAQPATVSAADLPTTPSSAPSPAASPDEG